MKTKLPKLILLTLLTVFSINLLTLNTIPASAEDVCSSNAPQVVKDANGCSKTGDKLPSTITNILYVVISVLGIVAVIFVLIGGYNYMTSAGDANKVKKGKETILYACIGLVICALAFVIVNWTISAIDGKSAPSTNTTQNDKEKESDD